jgi:hypothetical protein
MDMKDKVCVMKCVSGMVRIGHGVPTMSGNTTQGEINFALLAFPNFLGE